MSGLELAGFVLGILGPVEQCVTLINLLQSRFNSYRTYEKNIKQLIPSLCKLKRDLKQLETQLHQYNQYNQSIPQHNFQIFKDHLTKMQTMFTTALECFTDIQKAGRRKIFRFRKATKWAEHCESIQSNIDDAQHKILQINSFLCQTSVVLSSAQAIVRDTNNNIYQAIKKHDRSLSTGNPIDEFKPYFLKLPVSIAAKSNFQSLDSYGNPSTTEAKIKNQLLKSSQYYQTKIFAIHGPGGVGKTTCMDMLSHEHHIRQHFIHGIYYLKTGADAKTETAIAELLKLVRNSGGMNMGAKPEV